MKKKILFKTKNKTVMQDLAKSKCPNSVLNKIVITSKHNSNFFIISVP